MMSRRSSTTEGFSSATPRRARDRSMPVARRTPTATGRRARVMAFILLRGVERSRDRDPTHGARSRDGTADVLLENVDEAKVPQRERHGGTTIVAGTLTPRCA